MPTLLSRGSITISRLDDAYSVSLDNESYTIPASSTGVVTLAEVNKVVATVFASKGENALLGIEPNAIPLPGQFRYNIPVGNMVGCTVVRVDNKSFRLTNITTDSASVKVDIWVEGLQFFSKVLTITKARAGQDGSPGSPGIQGPFQVPRGPYSPTAVYAGTSAHIDVVKYNNIWYMAKKDAGTFTGIAPLGSKWEAYEGNFESIATGVFFAEKSTIENLVATEIMVGGLPKPADQAINDSIDAISIGGRNYYKNISTFDAIAGAVASRNALNGIDVTGTPANTAMLRIYNVFPEVGTYTISFEMRVHTLDWNATTVIMFNGETISNGALPLTTVLTKFSFTGVIASLTQNFIDFAGLSGQGHTIKNIKVERGTKATDWTPAPEDIEADAQAAANAALVAANAYTEAQDILVKSQTEAYADGIVTAEEQARIDQAAANLQEAKDDAQAKAAAAQAAAAQMVANVQVGGRNYYKGSTIIGTFNGAVASKNTGNGITVHGTGGNNGVVRIYDIFPEVGTYTLSFEMKADTVDWYLDTHVQFNDARVGPVMHLTTQINKFSFTGEVTDLTPPYNFIDIEGLSNQWHTIRNIKVEKGNKATDWSPAPEDVEALALAAEAKAQAVSDKIGALPAGMTLIGVEDGVAYLKTDLINVNRLVVKQLETDDSRLSINKNGNSLFEARYDNGQVGMKFGTNDAGMPVLSAFDIDGTKLWDLGTASTEIIKYVTSIPESWQTMGIWPIGSVSQSTAQTKSAIESKVQYLSLGHARIQDNPTKYYNYNKGDNAQSSANDIYTGWHSIKSKSTTNWATPGLYIFPGSIIGHSDDAYTGTVRVYTMMENGKMFMDIYNTVDVDISNR